MLGLPDDFKYHNEPFFMYYQSRLVENLNRFRVNKNFRKESLTRLKMALVGRFSGYWTASAEGKYLNYIKSDGSYLFNFRIRGKFSYADILLFCQSLARYRGIATVPYPTGVVRFSLGGYISAGKEGMKVFTAEIEDAFSIFIKYWIRFADARNDVANKEVESGRFVAWAFSVMRRIRTLSTA